MLSRSMTFQPQNPSIILNIILDKSSYFVDEYISGKIEINSSVQIVLNDVLLSFNLLENWVSKENESINIGDSNTTCILTKYLEIRKQLKINTNLISLKPGKFTFPFLFKIPKAVICCFEYPTRIERAYIRYSLSGQIISPYAFGNTSTYVLLKSRPVMQNKNFKYTASTNIHKWGLFNSGSTSLNIVFTDNKYSFVSGETINLNIMVDNTNGKLTAKQCKITLIRSLILKSKYGKIIKDLKNICLTKTLDTPTNIKEKKDFPCSIELKDFDNSIFNHTGAKLPYVNITDINYFLPSVNSSIIECKYILKVTLYFNNFVKHDERPRIMIPIYFCHQSVDDYKKEVENYYKRINNINNSQIYNNPNNQYNNNSQINNNQINYNNNNQINMMQQPINSSRTLMDNNNFQNPLQQNQNIGEEDIDLPSQTEIEKPGNYDQTEDLGAPSFDAPAPCFGQPPK